MGLEEPGRIPERLPCDWHFVGIAGDPEVTCHLLRHLEAPYTATQGRLPD